MSTTKTTPSTTHDFQVPFILDKEKDRITPESVEVLHQYLKTELRKLRKLGAKNTASPQFLKSKPAFVAIGLQLCKATSILIRRGEEKDGVAGDDNNILSGNYNQLGSDNPFMQEVLKEARLAYKKSGTDDVEVAWKDPETGKTTTCLYSKICPSDFEATEDNPVSAVFDDQNASAVLDDISGKDKDTLTEDQKVVDSTTKDGGRVRWDKENMTIQFYYGDGTKMAPIALAPQNTWRRTVVNFVLAILRGVWQTVRHPIETARKVGRKFMSLFSKKDDVKQAVKQTVNNVKEAVNDADDVIDKKLAEANKNIKQNLNEVKEDVKQTTENVKQTLANKGEGDTAKTVK